MPPVPIPPPFAAIIVAAGQGMRAGQPLPKQFTPWRGSTVLRHAAEALRRAGAGKIMIAHPVEYAAETVACIWGEDGMELVAMTPGGATRQESVWLALEALVDDAPERVLIHDAARPDCPPEVVERLLAALDHHPGAVPALPVVDSLAMADGNLMADSADREILRRVQTPQAFRYPDILAAHRRWQSERTAGDDAQVARAAGLAVALVEGDERLKKLTFAEDFDGSVPAVRVGMGYDVHRLAAGEELWLGGVLITHDKGLVGHSDADVALHALVDAILGALGEGDIGTHFPPSDARWKGAASSAFVAHAAALAAAAGYGVAHADLTIICEAPRIGPYREAMRARIAELLGVAAGCISIKATTTEGLGFTGRGEGIAAQAVATLQRL